MALGTALTFILTFKKPKRDIEKEKASKIAKAKKQAFKEMKTLQKLLNNQELEAFYIGLTNTLHKYLHDYFHLDADTKTTEEFLQEISLNPHFDKDEKSKLKTLLENADQVKYGHLAISENSPQDDIKSAYRLIEKS